MNIAVREILIFKGPSDDSENEDLFQKQLQEAGFLTRNIPVLEFKYVNLEIFETNLRNADLFSGLIFTSPRGVKAITLIKDSVHFMKEWKSKPLFVVGEGTSRILQKELGLDGQGSNSGNASALADVIMQYKYDKPLLFPCGNLKHDTLPNKLNDGGIDLVPVTVYETQIHSQLEQNLQSIILQNSSVPEMFVYFSPSGVKFTMPILQKLKIPVHKLKLVAIGPTTEESLRGFNLKVSAVALKPTPKHLLDAVNGSLNI